MFTPHKHMRMLGIGLASTSSGSFLVTKPKLTHLDIGKLGAPVFERIPDELREPDWEILRRSTALPNYTWSRLETRCESLEQELLDAWKLLRAHEVISEGQNAQLIVQNMGMDKLKKATDKATKKAKREAWKAEKVRLEAEWKEMLATHVVVVDKWAGQCLQLKAAGTKAKDLPKRPKRPLKPRPKGSDGDTSGEDESDEE
ncbi:hypothetical protein C8R44DRAFT_868350 [Mycena epipterygia]|nr:hypothetical protein C8R44DRAFT_868350 [Mycena epipterygia]